MKLRQPAKLVLATLTVFVLFATACGGDDDTGESDASERETTTSQAPTTEAAQPDGSTTTATEDSEGCPEEMPAVDVTPPDVLQQDDIVEIDSRLYYGPGNMAEDCEDVVLSQGPDYCSVESECPATGLFTGHDVALDCFLVGTSEVANFNLDFREAYANHSDARVTDHWIKVTISDDDHPDAGSSGFVSGAWLMIDLDQLDLEPCG